LIQSDKTNILLDSLVFWLSLAFGLPHKTKTIQEPFILVGSHKMNTLPF